MTIYQNLLKRLILPAFDKLKKLPNDLNNLKSKVDKLDVYQHLKPVSVDFKKINVVVKNEIVKKTIYDELVKKINAINTSGFTKKQIMIIR